ncbi:MAG: UDP-3-O-[3-hydroxymyristoyl] N-acetylglucosamine deacetylase [Idiomarina sp.]|uniref:UDP-3-O-acyl-N-acetylglucosamine deacetylase n=1 Tax=Idiomarina aquatica TaxID=1327752 RepID=A0A4R6P6H3_9GAMM|nr:MULTISPECIES: UDP-3-O-acyl-N-acetylglucosamine deacetylase [Idiomarina]MAK71468.1 UDP-3-O-[3-hydroxymyristoyl] N-acetylglucosamine deacetylase [Idiomarinaceae bacterium]MBL4741441.1 UDP-3-O-acyl-N-acetylglucosamine deacetylase [Idiomarina sp.]MBT43763.1 UDP-3-O-[3-hydroxymyristoyl] N-acetylglucosamine deacetylase [Idiomarina sp.]PHQ77916.1 MAG: UDP-3-O-[3-hydroxymyristoyl] N-acetylglucosamine deacetylase [Idiomarina sp.]TDP32680.1 UDP-3-O-[3-hydroxymyristoyl] N-acetylglucosamine deacetylase
MVKQRTLQQAISTTGVGLHKGNKVNLTLRPAPANTGLIFRRVDLDPAVDIPARADWVRDTQLCTCLINEQNVRISTVEHLLAALAGVGIDNCIIEVDSHEIPIMDGSSHPFVYLLQSAGIEEQSVAKKFIRIKSPIRVEEEDGKWAELLPYDGFRIDFAIDFDHPAIAETGQAVSMDFNSGAFIKEISRARTFGFMKDIEYLRKNNLALGGSFDNAVVLDEFRVLNTDGLRYDDEFVKHKMLDAIGDLYMGGHSILGHLRAYKSGHALNNQLLQALLQQQEAWEFVTFDDAEAESPITYWAPSLA